MAKAVRWKVPFVSRKGTQYEVEIYDDSSNIDWTNYPTITTLKGGINTITTRESGDTYFFAGIRPHTGTLSLIDTDGTLMDSIMPEHNLQRMVRIVSISGQTRTTEWQGFLSAEAYTQDFTGMAHTIDITINSILGAMDSAEIPNSNSGMLTFREVIAICLQQMQTQSGYTIWDNNDRIYLSATAYRFIERKINMSVFFTENEQTNENTTTYVVTSMSIKNILNAICVFMGLTLQECGKYLYFARKDSDYGMRWYTYQGFIGSGSPTLVNNTTIALNTLTWMGTNHNKSVEQGAKSVEVVANLDSNKINISVPAFPNGASTYKRVGLADNDDGFSHCLLSQNTTAYSNISFAYYKATYPTYGSRGQNWASWNLTGFLQKFMNNHLVYEDPSQYESITSAAGATYAKNILNSYGTQPTEWDNEGIFCTFLPMANESSASNPILTMRNNFSIFLNTGFIHLHCNADLYAEYIGMSGGVAFGATTIKKDILTILPNLKIRMRLRIGDKYLKCENVANVLTYSWVTTPTDFYTTIVNNDFIGNWKSETGLKERTGIILPITEEMKGDVELLVYPEVFGYEYQKEETIDQRRIEGIYFQSLSVDYLLGDGDETSRNANHFFRLLGTHFRDEISVQTMFASYFKNTASPSIIMVDNTTTAQNVVYTLQNGTSNNRRPELDLLNRLAAYYGKARRILKVMAEHITSNVSPLLHITDGGKDYVPMFEDMDWQMDTSEITLMETPEGDE